MRALWICISIITIGGVCSGSAWIMEARLGETADKDVTAQTNERLAPEALAKKSGCFECHSIDKNLVGPAYRSVAERYKGDAKARTTLIETVKKGGKGNWSEITRGVPMPPHQGRLSTADITRLVDWVLSLGDK